MLIICERTSVGTSAASTSAHTLKKLWGFAASSHLVLMTSRRASASGVLIPRMVAVSRLGVLLLGLLLLPACALHAATASHAADTRSPRTHRATLQSPGNQSAGKASAHAIHDTDTHPSRTPEKAANRHSNPGARNDRSRASDRSSTRSSGAAHKGTPATRHAQDSDDTRHTAKAQGGRKRRKEPPVDEPVLVNRARLERNKRGAYAQQAETRSAHRSHAQMAARTGSSRRSSSLEPRHIITAPATSAAYTPRPVPVARTQPVLTLAAPAPADVNTALSESAPAPTQVIEGFGAEVDFHAPADKPARSAPILLPRESPAQQERELRAAADVASQPMFVPLYARDGKLIVPPPLKGSHDILVHQNQMADDAGLTRIQDDDDLDRLRRARLLVDFPESASLHLNEALPENRRSARPWTVKFATDIAHAFYARFGEPLQVNSAVRTVAYQLRLQRTNGNAAAVDGEGASPHLTGQALDFGKRGMSLAEIAWMRSYLTPLIDEGKIDVEEEFQQACFHISVYANYMPAPRIHAPAKTEVAQASKAAHPRSATAAEINDNLR